MATITNAALSLTHDHQKKTVNAVAKCTVNFTALEMCMMKTCPGARHFKLKCQLCGEDTYSFLPGSPVVSQPLFTYSNVYYFPDATPNATESRTFEVVLGEGVLNEDSGGEDEIYAKFTLVNLSTLVEVKKKSNTVHHSF